MARPLRIQYSGAWYHVMNRGTAHQFIYQTEKHRHFFLSLLAEVNLRYQAEIHAYCLMSNHYHLLLRTPLPNLNRIMRHIDGIYTQHYNKSLNRDGPLFRGRYKSCLIEAENYLLQTSRYIHLNPVVAKIVANPEDYKWSSYRYYINLESPPSWLTIFDTLQFFETNTYQFYQNFVKADLDAENEFTNKIKKSPVLGSDSFIEHITQFIPSKHQIADIPMHKEFFFTITIDQIQTEVAKFFNTSSLKLSQNQSKFTSLPKIITLYLAIKLTGKTYREIGMILGNPSVSAISHTYRNIQKKLVSDSELAAIIQTIEQRLYSSF